MDQGTLNTLLAGAAGAGIVLVGSIATAIVNHFLSLREDRIKKEFENIQQARWELKYRACLDALGIVDAFLSHWVKDFKGVMPLQQTVDTVKARECHSRLALTCQNPEVTEIFLRIMFPAPQTSSIEITESLNALRNAIRTELGFGKSINLSHEFAWFVRLAGDNRKDTGQESSSTSTQPPVEPTPTLAP